MSLIFSLLCFQSCARSRSPKLEVWTISLRPLYTSYMKNVIGKWEAAHPGIKVDWVDVPIDAVQQKLIAGLISGSPPSVVNLNTQMAFQLAETGALTDLDPEVSSQVRRRYYPGFWDALRYEGAHFAVPWYVSAEILIYNGKIFQAAGLEPARPPATWDDLAADAVRIKQKTGLYGWLPALKFIPDLEEQGIAVVDSAGKKALFDSPEAVKRLSMYVDLFQKGNLPRETLLLSKAYSQAVDYYQSGKLGILQTGPQFLARVRDNSPSVYAVTRVAPLPLGRSRVISAAVMNLVIPKNAPYRKEALDFALFLANDENQLAFSRKALVFPSTIQASRSPFFTQSSGPDPLLAAARRIGAAELVQSRDLTLGLKNAKARDEAVQIAVQKALMGRESPKRALHEAASAWDKLLQ